VNAELAKSIANLQRKPEDVTITQTGEGAAAG
jgi:hypothetical protein